MVYYLRPRSSMKGSPSYKTSPYKFYRASPVKESSPSSLEQVSSSPVLVSPVLESSDQESSKNMNAFVPYLIISVIVAAVVSVVIMVGVKPCEGCCEFLTKKDNETKKVQVNHPAVLGFSLLIGLGVGFLCFVINYFMPSLLGL